MSEVITRLEQVTAEWLTGILTRRGVLSQGVVAGFTMDSTQRELSANARITVQYSDGAQGEMPRSLFLKLVTLDMEDEFFGPSEVNYYARDYVGVPDVPILRAYDAAYSDSARRYHVLMDDVSSTHVEARSRTPALDYGLALAEGLAAMHAHWWGRERLEAGNEPIPPAEGIRRFVEVAEPGAGHILAACADQLKPHWTDRIRELYARHPQAMIERTREGNGFTLIHGDVNGTNILVPAGGWRPLYIIDRQPFDWSLTTWLGVYDLAYAIVLRWDGNLRRALEKPVLKHYHQHLTKRGVTGYSWEQLWDDYRLSVGMGVYVATEWCRGALNRDTMPFWMPMLLKTLTAIDDLECEKLW